MQAEIKVKQVNIVLALTERQLLTVRAITSILADEDKHAASAKITVTSAVDKETLIKNRL